MQLIFNNTSGGGNKVKINGLPPTERLNLKEIETAVWHKNFLPIRPSWVLSTQSKKIIYMSNDYSIIEKEIGGIRKEIGKSNKKIERVLVKDNILYGYYFSNASPYPFCIIKCEDGVATIISETDKNKLGINYFNSAIFLNNEIYLRTTSPGDKIFKSSDFGVTWTDITNQIKNNTNISLEELFSGKLYFNINNILYIHFRKTFYKFDGNKFEVFKENIEFTSREWGYDFTNYKKAYILETKLIYRDSTNKCKYDVYIYKIENTEKGTDITLEKKFESYNVSGVILNTKDISVFWKEHGEENGLCYIEEPVKTYISE